LTLRQLAERPPVLVSQIVQLPACVSISVIGHLIVLVSETSLPYVLDCTSGSMNKVTLVLDL
jgi:hypothetical protein